MMTECVIDSFKDKKFKQLDSMSIFDSIQKAISEIFMVFLIIGTKALQEKRARHLQFYALEIFERLHRLGYVKKLNEEE